MKDLELLDTMPVKKTGCLKTAIMKSLGWDELEYAEFQYEQGLIYLDTYLKGMIGPMDALLRSRIFWNWWKNHWAIRERCFLMAEDLTLSQRRNIYKGMHDGRMLASDIRPNSVVLEESYSEMMHKVVKQEVRQV